ncbi:MAG: methylated-DNA--[protein]-cysteine S-methyltransferase [Vallitalea sp.]|nr:methylated-DNA--[protein]-cysteine S-methyltransferase [Vallitalea sp.]
MYYTILDTMFCEMVLVGDEQGLTNIYLNTEHINGKIEISDKWILNNDFFVDIINELNEYISGERKVFSVKLNLEGTEFQKKVWNELIKIPYGKLYTYKQIATLVGNENASRAVGTANNKNPIPIIIPCHRVIGSNGKLVGYAGGLKLKEQLINHECRYK